ncbi:class II aldolase/adducin family protein [Streptomyces sp. NPDC008150]|uniref:class II aldolase/adducin family protein n=1 Tax=Streptomyces sp. NPDC008150 TaxID=3364816 RepID=UPI0036F103CD
MTEPANRPDPGGQEPRAELATATRILARHGMIGMFGHVSLLTEDPGQYLICPGAGRRKDRCRPEDVHELSLDAEFAPGLPLELYMHAAMHRAHPEIRSLVHVHSPNLTALAAMAEPPAELLMLHASFWPEHVPLWERPELVTDHAAGDELVRLTGDSAVALLRWHGAVVTGRTVREAVFRTVLAEYHAGVVLASLAHGRPLAPVPVPRDELYARVLPATTHDMNWRFESSYVELDD